MPFSPLAPVLRVCQVQTRLCVFFSPPLSFMRSLSLLASCPFTGTLPCHPGNLTTVYPASFTSLLSQSPSARQMNSRWVCGIHGAALSKFFKICSEGRRWPCQRSEPDSPSGKQFKKGKDVPKYGCAVHSQRNLFTRVLHFFYFKLRDDSNGIKRKPYSLLSDTAGELGLLGVESRVSE